MQRVIFRAAALAVLGTVAAGAFAADHVDSPAATADIPADITDVYAFMSADGKSVDIALDVAPFATTTSKFSDAVTYAIHVNSSTGYGKAQTETLVLCQFATSGTIQCWAGDKEYVTGDASKTAGIASTSGKLKVFAGLRNDPFFFELDGFKTAVQTVEGVAGTLNFNAAHCPAINMATSTNLVGQLSHEPNGTAPKDTFATKNVLAIVLEIDKAVLTSGGSTLGIWASTHQKS